MQIGISWLREWVDVGDDVAALAHALTMAGLEVEGNVPAAPPSSGLVVGEVLSVGAHPDAEKLQVCRVTDGSTELQIVCGARNVQAGMKVPLARVGAKLPDGTVIASAKLRGVESAGMLCSAREIGLGEDVPGLLELPSDAAVGQDLNQALALDDRVLTLNLTPNRGDCMSVTGVAREVAAVRDVPLHPPVFNEPAQTVDDQFPVVIEAPAACRKFLGRVIRGVRGNQASPLWLRERLRRAGLRPLNVLVDITNYVMLELGQPMHAYDLRSLKDAVVVRFARPGEQLRLLDGREVTLEPDVLVIADREKVLGMAGVMGGFASGVADDTQDIFLEVASFVPSAIAGRGRRHGLITEASQRFERGVDTDLQGKAMARATALILALAGGRAGPVAAAVGEPARPVTVSLRLDRLRRVIGVALTETQVEGCLKRLGLPAMRDANAERVRWQVRIPSWRADLAIEEDLIEEVLRIHGFERVPAQAAPMSQQVLPWTETQIRLEQIAERLTARGYQEVITYSFVEPGVQSLLFPDEPVLALANPISAELAVMRLSLWPGLLLTLRDNQRRQQARVRLFETGRQYRPTGEIAVIAGLAAGALLPEQWAAGARQVSFHDVKADVEALLQLTNTVGGRFRFEPAQHPALHPGQTARVLRDGAAVGWLGTLHPKIEKALGLTYPAILFELEQISAFSSEVPKTGEISRFPQIRRDLAVIVDESVTFERLREAVQGSAGGVLTELTVFDVYRGTGIDKGKKSIALGLKLQDTSRTLTDQDADAIVSRVVSHLAGELAATLRDK